MEVSGLEVGELYKLGRRLTEISRDAALNPGDPKLPMGETVVLEDVLTHPGSAVSEISERTGVAQSYVSRVVAQLQSSGTLETKADPADRRRTLVRVADRLSQGVFSERGSRTVDGAIAAAIGDSNSQEAKRAVEMLEELARLLLPGATHPSDGA